MSSQSLKEMSDAHTHSSPLLAEPLSSKYKLYEFEFPSPGCSPNSQDAHPALPLLEMPEEKVRTGLPRMFPRWGWEEGWSMCDLMPVTVTLGEILPTPNTTHIHNQSFLTLDGKCDSVCHMILRTSRECILYTHLQVFQPVPQIFLLVSAPWITLLSPKGRPLSKQAFSIPWTQHHQGSIATNSVAKDPRLLRLLMKRNSGTIKFTSLKYTIHWFFTYLQGCAHITII